MSANLRRRVVVTGLGVVSPVGVNVPEFWAAVLNGQNGISKIDMFEAGDLTCQIAGIVRNFDAEVAIGDKKLVRQTDRFTHFGLGAAIEAVKDSGLDFDKTDRDRIGALIGSGIGGLIELFGGVEILMSRGPGRMNPHFIPKLMLNAAAGQIAIFFGIRGPNWACASACASTNHAVGTALRIVQYGDADIMLTGGSEATITRLGMGGFCAARAMATDRNDDPEHASRPFDKDRSGFVMGEGGGILVFEELEHAKRRGAKIYCEAVGFGATDDAYHITSPSETGDGATACMTLAMKDGGLNPQDITYINAHGTSTPYNDKTESKAIRRVLGAHADKVMVSSTKSMVGHLLGGSGAVELVACAKTIETGRIHPTRNYTTPDPDCDLDYVANTAREGRIKAVLKNSFGFGGHNATLALKRFEG